MPLTESSTRREIHQRIIQMQAFERSDGLYDVEARLTDRKPFPFKRPSGPDPVPAGEFLHDLWVRLTLDGDYVVRAVEASSDTTPWALCKEAEGTLQVLVGQTVGRGWSAVVKERLRGTASCTHLMEMLIPMATVSFQGMRAVRGQAGSPELLLDTCYAFSGNRQVVRLLWPELARPEHKRDPPAAA
jgi:hypothetical protein